MSTLNRNGQPRKASAVRGNDPEFQKSLVDAYSAGLGLARVAAKFKMSLSGARYILLKSGVVMRPKGPCPPDWPHIREMRELRADSWTFQEIADKYGVTRQCVHQTLKRIEPKSP